MNIVKAKLVTYFTDFGGYTNYVFEKDEYSDAYDHYIMCTRFPNWEHEKVNVGDSGFLSYREVRAGVDTWYDCKTGSNIPYNYSGVHFLKFVKDIAKADIIL